ncbi:MAG: hypothetical protein GXO86_14190, partial [Chlorobi bacterium]|nr:hypothetical protein [Chlorobiota bacterium]
SGATILLAFIITACTQQKKGDIIASKIQYDVNIVSPDTDYDWWIQNLPGPQREKLVNLIIEGAKSGKFQAYDYFNNPISKEEVAGILSDTTFFSVVDENPPYEEHDTLVVYNIKRADVMRIRFLEEWAIDPNTLKIEKRVLGIAPIARRYDAMGIERWQPLFWIYTDKDYAKTLQKQ